MTLSISANDALREVTPPGVPARAWDPWRESLPTLTLDDLLRDLDLAGSPAGLVVVSAHPDDETIGLGRLMSAWGRAVGPVTSLLATDGEACFDAVAPRPAGLADARCREWRLATRLLGVDHCVRMGLPDGRLAEESFALTRWLERLVGPSVDRPEPQAQVVLASPLYEDPHPDHTAVAEAVRHVCEEFGLAHLEFPVWFTFRSWPDEGAPPALQSLACDRTANDAWRSACEAFPSQFEPLIPGYGPVVPPELLDHHQMQLVRPMRGMSGAAS